MIHFPGPFVQKGGLGPLGPPLAMAMVYLVNKRNAE